ncbi:hypothetical protein [Lysinibacillus fusiformis]|uniref:hypothetical protein n=1 Tax=Lysinibacillus fusiformis TaxID=28031 RepID=UPI0034E1C219
MEPYKFFNMRKDGAPKGTQFGDFAPNFIGTIIFSQYGLEFINLLATRLIAIFTK